MDYTGYLHLNPVMQRVEGPLYLDHRSICLENVHFVLNSHILRKTVRLMFALAWFPTPLSAMQTNTPACSLLTEWIMMEGPDTNFWPVGSSDF